MKKFNISTSLGVVSSIIFCCAFLFYSNIYNIVMAVSLAYLLLSISKSILKYEIIKTRSVKLKIKEGRDITNED